MAQYKKKTENTVKSASSKTTKKKNVAKADKNKAQRTKSVRAASAVKGELPKKRKNRETYNNSLNIIPLGGIDEIGKNLTAYECRGDIIIVDCGLSFPDDEMYGVDIVIADMTYLVNNKERIKGLFVTHGHEDHIGGIPYLLKQIDIPIFATRLTIGLIKNKLIEHSLDTVTDFREVRPGDIVNTGVFNVEFIHVNHSIPDAVALAIKCPVGTVIQTGDFKIDTTPIDGDMIDIARLSQLGKNGVLALLSDSTNADHPGFTMSEKSVGQSFVDIFSKTNKRIIIATFSSNVHRVQQVIDCAEENGRKVALLGRSMINVVNTAKELGYLRVPDGMIIDIDMIKQYTDEQLVIVSTGSQGESMSALHRMAYGDHRKVVVGANDLVVISASAIPGNEKMIGNVINELMKLNAEVVYDREMGIHVSGHACQEELKLMIGITKPKFFIPVHGEQKHLKIHAGLAEQMGMEKERIVIPELGKIIQLGRNGIRFNGNVTAGRVLVDGFGVGDVGSIVLRDRKHLAEDGILIVSLAIDAYSGEAISGPEFISRGFVLVKESEDLMKEAGVVVNLLIEEYRRVGKNDWSALKNRIRDQLSHLFYQKTKRSPMILPIIMEA
ncbi:MAG: ribonuclease J [Clostridia bacterium]|nr:ribonuclease J [Clostridia bacterium]